MARVNEVTYEFVDSAPAVLVPGRMYISIKYRAIVHLCLCGCGEKVLLRLAPEDWSVTFDGRSISIHDSVGNVGIPCRSHYIVRRNHVTWLSPLDHLDPERALAARPAAEAPASREANGLRRWFRWRRSR